MKRKNEWWEIEAKPRKSKWIRFTTNGLTTEDMARAKMIVYQRDPSFVKFRLVRVTRKVVK